MFICGVFPLLNWLISRFFKMRRTEDLAIQHVLFISNLLRCLMGMLRVLLRANEVLNKLTVFFSYHVFWTAEPLNFIYAPGYLLSIEQPINRWEVVPFIYFPDMMRIHFVFLDKNLVLIWKDHFQVRFEMQVTLLLPTTFSRHQIIIMPVKDINWPGIGLSFSLWRQIKMLLGSDTTWNASRW